MFSYPYIEELFRNILKASSAMQGRFFICPRNGREINSDDLEQVIADLVIRERITKKYPLTLMAPPVSTGSYAGTNEDWDHYHLTLFFLTTSGYASTSQGMNLNPNTRTTQHTITQDWHDMKRCAVSFIKVLNNVQRKNNLVNTRFRLDQHRDKTITPISEVGVDRVSGVRLDFAADVFLACSTQEDYSVDGIASIIIPVSDSHPEHQL